MIRAPGRLGGGAGRGLQAVCALWRQQRCGRRRLLSPLPQHPDPLLSVPLGHSSPLVKESGKTGLEDVGTGGERAADPAAGHGLQLLSRGLAEVLCPEQRARSKRF